PGVEWTFRRVSYGPKINRIGSRREEPPGCQESVNSFRYLPTATTIQPPRLRHSGPIYGSGVALLHCSRAGRPRRVGYSNTESTGSWSSLGRRLTLDHEPVDSVLEYP